ncbi:AMP-binding protein [Streptomyces sp. TLI_171]|uniref:AMP-binding protein n=1 Tax=Streptomyces sp. TLI_171 TaxID=1938859 RepID=UPI000C1A29DF|nr:AMP-binding protein [Streptomyces sp. TLI_171]RKE21274.1 long-chain acyl-CoA synthetase [Streptomyces sp. TLI_171]
MADQALPAPGRLDGLAAHAAAAHPDRTAITGGAAELDFATLDARVTAVARVLAERLDGPGTVAVASALHPDFAVAYYGAARAGQVVAVVNPLIPEIGVQHVLATSRARLAFVDAGLLPKLKAVRANLPELREVVLIGGAEDGDTETLAALLDAAPADGSWSPAAVDLDDAACIQFTSGTTGLPKAVRLTHRNLTVNAAQIAAAHRLDAASVSLNHLPTYHPMHLNSAVAAAATQVLCDAPEPVDAVHTANTHGATHFYSLPVRLARLAADPALDGLALRTVTRIASGGSALPVEAAEKLTARFGIPVFQGYGLAETSPLTHSDDPDHPAHGSVGRPVPGTECRVVDLESGAELPAGQPGEVQLRGPQVMKGYLGSPELAPGDWFTTGDIGRVDEQGRLFLIDRLGDVFKVDNFLVAPSEVEQVLSAHPLVREAVVVGLPDGHGYRVAGALLVLDAPDRIAEVVEQVNGDLPYYQRLQHAEAVDAIPRSGNGKIQRRVLAGQFAARLGLADPQTEGSRDMAAPLFTVINTFVLKDPSGGAAFEQRFLDHVQWMRAQFGFRSHQAVRATEQPDVYVNFGWWATPGDFQQVLGSETFQAHAKEFHQLVDVQAEPSMGVLRVDGAAAEDGAVLVVERFTVTEDADKFEAAYRGWLDAAQRAEGLGHADLAKALMRPGGYTALTRWVSEDAWLAARQLPEYADLAALADSEVRLAAPVAGTRTPVASAGV